MVENQLAPRVPRSGAFTLLELVVVILIMGVLFAILVPTFSGPAAATKLSTAGSSLAENLEQARQQAMLLNKPVAFQFVKQGSPGAEVVGYRLATQQSDGTYEPGRFVRWPQGIRALEGGIHETLISDLALGTSSVTDTSLGTSPNTSSDLVYFHFFPDGSTDLPNEATGGEKWFATLVLGDQPIPPANFFTVSVDPVTGRVFRFRP